MMWQYNTNMNHLLCFSIQQPPTLGMLVHLMTQNSEIMVAFNSKVICFSANDSTALMIIGQKLKNGVYSVFFNESYQMLAQRDEQIQLFLKDSVKINSMEDINIFFQKDLLERQKLNENNYNLDLREKYQSEQDQSKPIQQISAEEHKNLTCQMQERQQEQTVQIQKHEDEQVKKVELQNQGGSASHKYIEMNPILSQTKVQPQKSNAEKLEEQKQMKKSTYLLQTQQFANSTQLQLCSNQSQILQCPRKEEEVNQPQAQEQPVRKIVEQILLNKIIEDAQEQSKTVQIKQSEKEKESVEKCSFKSQQVSVKKNYQRSSGSNIFIIVLLVTWLILLLLFYS